MRPIVLERSRGVGGRCATRRVDGQPVDHGLVFLHGSDPALVEALRAVPATHLDGWPTRVRGRGSACQPAAFQAGDDRIAYEEGLSAFPKSLARGLDVRLEQDIARLAIDGDAVVATTRDGTVFRGDALVLALALEQSRALLSGIGDDRPEILGMRRLLDTFATVPSLTVLAGYAPDVARPVWDVLYPEDSEAIQLVAHDSAKRPAAASMTLVLQARPAWSRRHLEDPPDVWAAELLADAGRRIGAWAVAPEWMQPHVWRHARLEPGNELAAPVLLALDGGARLGLAGELFGARGGLQAAFVSGRHLAYRLIGKGSLEHA